MAVPSSSPLSKSKASSRKETKRDEAKTVTLAGEPQPPKRSKNPGVRVIGGRVYCPVNGKTCHQCRQKTMDISASCTNMKGQKQCTIKFCQKCLWNRYGEKAEVVAESDNWTCPKCRDICNCSFCMKKKGHQPTGILAYTAKKTGFSSVSELLGSGKLDDDKFVEEIKKSPKRPIASKKELIVEDTKKSPKRPVASKKELIVEDIKKSPQRPVASKKELIAITPTKLGKENSLGRMVVLGLGQEVDAKSPERTPKKRKSECLKGCNGIKIDNSPLKSLENLEQKLDTKADRKEKDQCGPKERKNRKLNIPSVPAKEEVSVQEVLVKEVPLPQGSPLITVGGVELPGEAIGEALQFLEFCATFGKALDMRKGQAELVLRELLSSRRRRHGQPPSLIVRLHIQLMSFILEELGEETPSEAKDAWLKALAKLVSESEIASSEFPSDCFRDGYEDLDILKKLRLLNFLCDEALSTEYFRDWIEEQRSKHVENGKEAKEKLVAARSKEKLLKQKMQDLITEAILSKSGPLTISEHDAIVSQVKQEIAQARAELLQISGDASKKPLICDAIRIESVFLDVNGRAFWKLKNCNGESDILLQDFGTCDSAKSEKWFSYDAEKKGEVDAYIWSFRTRNPAATRQP